MAGDKLGGWAHNVTNLVRDRLPNRYDDSQASVLAGLAVVEEWAYIAHDDMIVIRPVDYIAPAHRGKLSAYNRGGDYYARAKAVLRWLQAQGHPDPLNYNVHRHFLVNAPAYLELAARAAEVPAGFRASIYGNLVGLRASQVYDPKVIAAGSRPRPDWPVLSMSDRSFKSGYIGKVVKRAFPTPGEYETVGSATNRQEIAV